MRTIERTSQFKRDYRRETRGLYRETLELDFLEVLMSLIHDQPLAEKYRDHALIGDWKDYRDCHIKPDLILIYRKPDVVTLYNGPQKLDRELRWKTEESKVGLEVFPDEKNTQTIRRRI